MYVKQMASLFATAVHRKRASKKQIKSRNIIKFNRRLIEQSTVIKSVM